VKVDKGRRSTRNVSGRVKYTDSTEESDGENEPSLKKIKSEPVENKNKVVLHKRRLSNKGKSQTKIVKMNKEHSKENETEKNELECPECEYRSRSVYSWWRHLKEKHSTTPTLAGCLIRCDCGHESYSFKHSIECEISNFTFIRTGDGVIRRVQMTPQCVLCRKYPKTPFGYIQHLQVDHKTTLKRGGIFLICACGLNY
ncbi:hypothetical protein PMAYCL1PPCAC_01496, partial [Pristionchus mayeri]